MSAHGYTRAEATAAAEKRWTDHVTNMYAMMLMRKAKSWFTATIPTWLATSRALCATSSTTAAREVRDTINAVAAKGYEGVVLGADRGSAAERQPGRRRWRDRSVKIFLPPQKGRGT